MQFDQKIQAEGMRGRLVFVTLFLDPNLDVEHCMEVEGM